MDWTLITSAVTALGVLTAAVGIIIAIIQIKQTKQQAITAFEDEMARQYRDIIQRVPVKALLNEELSEKVFEVALNELYNYIDLTNEQVFLRQQNRIREETWKSWRDGIKSNLSLPAFKKAWEIIKEKVPHNFEELRILEKANFAVDPKDWNNN